ncbi:hypothetical protein SAMN05444358_10457 [Ruegeria halocynthiae]|uniref:Tetratricopeptide repeat-containing protein n=1 Tax=Ruegeria halocynthiae TaxID=985054 RepID=A0A1H3A892_9RHOB|nr:hypothetical protein [Ruegeria halocynthiae]SDX25099.1 hypothetical protein SAMN05444358_10457 [Ruegeria halocynthiae]
MPDPKLQSMELSERAHEACDNLDFPENFEAAELLFKQAFELDLLQPLDELHVKRANDYAWVLTEQSKFDEARSVINRTLSRISRSSDVEKLMVVELLAALANFEMQEGNLEEAEANLNEAVTLRRQLGITLKIVDQTREKNLAEVRALLGRPKDLEAQLKSKLDPHRANPLEAPGGYNSVLEELSAILISQHRYDEARQLIAEGRELRIKCQQSISAPDQWNRMEETIRSRTSRSH